LVQAPEGFVGYFESLKNTTENIEVLGKWVSLAVRMRGCVCLVCKAVLGHFFYWRLQLYVLLLLLLLSLLLFYVMNPFFTLFAGRRLLLLE